MFAIDLSFLPKDPTFWIIVAVCLTIVVVLAIIFGRGLKIGSLSLDRAPEKKPTDIVVGKDMEAKGLKVGGGVTGIRGAQASDRNVDVLGGAKLTDAEIHGDITGVELARQLTADGYKFPVIFMTGHGDVTVERKATAAGGIAFLRKPFPATTLMDAIKKAAG